MIISICVCLTGYFYFSYFSAKKVARLAQSVEHETLNLRVVGSSPTLGDHLLQESNAQENSRKGPLKSIRLIKIQF